MSQNEFLKLYNQLLKEEEEKQNSLFHNLSLNKSIIAQQDDLDDDEDLDDEDLDEEDDDDGDDEGEDEDEDLDEDDEEDDDDSQEQSDEEDDQKNQTATADLKFSADLASEFGNTVNQFTKVAASIIKQRIIKKQDSDKIYDLMSKIKNLLDAAGKSV